MQIKAFILKVPRGMLLISLFLTVSSFLGFLHPYYISVTEIRVNSVQRTVNLSCKLFTDDLQNALDKLYGAKADISKRNAVCDSLINKYVKERLDISIGKQKADFKFIGYEIEEEATWCYFEAPLPSYEQVVNVRSSILFDFIESQTNLLHCYYNQERKSFKLDKPSQDAVFNFSAK
jgi:hypothetical protein